MVDALVERARHGIFGYAMPTGSYYAAIVDWMARCQGWTVDSKWITTTPGVVVADEIHGDLIYPGETFTPFASLSEALALNTVVCTAPSKTFNLAGLGTSNIIIPDAERRARFAQGMETAGLFGANPFGIVALEAAYQHGDAWLAQVMDYVAGNYRYLDAFLAQHLPQISAVRPEGTYLVWLDCRKLGLDKEALERLMLEEARLFLHEGYHFGVEGEGFERINIACPRLILAEALERLKAAVDVLTST